ncbi:MAG: cupin domain-containing protein [Cyclobacteriaceae bacterium]|jgi:quercetin dioxygenase-like cupin family protein|nr:cupin domain-containing protein [Cyclobacteriaceae bacterium]
METKSSLSEPFIPVEQIDYAAGSVVSKTIVKNPSGNITLFAFDQGEGLSEHSSPHEAFVQVLDGKAEITIGGKKHIVPAGQCILMPSNVPHALKALEQFKMMLVMIRN